MPQLIIAMLFCMAPLLANAQQQLFRYIDKDGRTVYTDTVPPSDARSVQQKKLGGNFVETSEPPYALQMAQQRNPVTLYSGACGPVCDQAHALLNRRGVPYRDIDPSLPAEAQKMKDLAGDLLVPTLVIGGTILLKGFEEDRWQSALDHAGYPKTPAARITAIKRDADKAAADKVAGKAAGKGDAKLDAKGEARADASPETRK